MSENNNNNKLSPQLIYYYSNNKENSHKPLLLENQIQSIQSELLKNLNESINDYEIFAKKSFKELNPLNFHSFGGDKSKNSEDENKNKYNIIKDIHKVLKSGVKYNKKELSLKEQEQTILKIIDYNKYKNFIKDEIQNLIFCCVKLGININNNNN